MAATKEISFTQLTVDEMTGVQRTAVLLLSLGERHAAQILKHMGPKEVQELGMGMATLDSVNQAQIKGVLDRFIASLEGQTSLGMDSDDYIRNVLNQALGADKASTMIDRILLGRNSKGLEQLKWMDARAIAELIRLEHPQIIAIVLSFLESDQAAQVVGLFPERVRADIMMRVASLEGVQPAALQELDEILERQLSGNTNVVQSSMGGVKVAANILNLVEGSAQSAIMEQILELDQDIGQQIQDNMFVFDNLIDVDDRGIQSLLREVATDQLMLALRGADDGLKEKIFKNMSRRAAEMLRDDLSAAPPAKLSDVETAQKAILQVARRLADSGEISLGGGGGDQFV
ncbi:MAG: flagellar motor switch protein FliG [Pseudomonadota bacterium]